MIIDDRIKGNKNGGASHIENRTFIKYYRSLNNKLTKLTNIKFINLLNYVNKIKYLNSI